MRRRDYNKQLKVWTSQYMVDPTPEQAQKFNPTVFKLKTCAKCGKPKKGLQRHHKGHEFMFANIRPKEYAKRYCEFHPDDIAYLCKRCHKNEGVYMKALVRQVIEECTRLKGMSYERCEFWRMKIIKQYNKWIKQPPRRKNVNSKQLSNHFLDGSYSSPSVGVDRNTPHTNVPLAEFNPKLVHKEQSVSED